MAESPSRVVASAHEPSPSRIIKEACALEQMFEDLCLEITSSDTARLFGSDADGQEQREPVESSLQGGPRKGSLRVFAQQVVQKVSRKGCTTYQQIADELIAELQEHKRQDKLHCASAAAQPDKKRRRTTSCELAADAQTIDDDGEKNIRRRVYDSLNVLKAIGAVMPLKDLIGTAGKDIVWVGLPRRLDQLNAAQTMQDELRSCVRQVQQKNEQLQAIASQYMLLAKLIKRNSGSCHAVYEAQSAEDRIPLPFIILQAEADAKLDVKMSNDQTMATFNFSRSSFQVFEDYVILQQMGL